GTAHELRSLNPSVSLGLADILARCLETDPNRRYADAAALAADLQRHLKDLPLRGVPNRSLAERWHKWRRRRPYSFPLFVSLLLVVFATVAGVFAHFRARLDQGRTALAEGKARLEHHRYAEAVATLQRGLSHVETVPFHHDLEDALRDALRQAESAGAAE